MLCNIPSFLNKSGLIERQVLAGVRCRVVENSVENFSTKVLSFVTMSVAYM